MRWAFLLAVVGLLAPGCAAPGRVALACLDTRTPEQLRAAAAADLAPYLCPECRSNAAARAAAGAFPWETGLKALPLLHGRIEVGVWEWGGAKR